MRKLRADSFAGGLDTEQYDELMRSLNSSLLSYEEAASKVAAWTGQSISATAVANHFSRHRMSWRLQKGREAADAAMAAAPKNVDEHARQAIGYQRMVAVLGELSPAEIAVFERNELSREKLQIERDRLALDREKFAALQARENKAKDTLENETLTPEQKSARLKEIFGLR